MLYDPKWEKPADVFSLENLIAWLEQQPADTTYCYTDSGGCLLCKYFSAMGFTDVSVNPFAATCDGVHVILPVKFNDIAQDIGSRSPPKWTFGAALERARAALAA